MRQGKTVRILNFKRNYFNLYSSVTALLALNCKFEEKHEKAPTPKSSKPRQRL